MLLLLAMLTSAEARRPSEEVCVRPDRELREWAARPPAVGASDPWRALRTALDSGARPEAPFSAYALLSYLPWNDPLPADGPLAVRVETASHPERAGHTLVRVAVRAAEPPPPSVPRDVVVIVDVSPSMESRFARHWSPLHHTAAPYDDDAVYPADSRLDLARVTLHRIAAELGPADRLSVVTFGVEAHTWLTPTAGDPDDPLVLRIDGLSILSRPAYSTGYGDPVGLALEVLRDHGRGCRDRRFLVLSDGGAPLGDDPVSAMRDIARSGRGGPTWSGITLGRATTPAQRLEGLAWLGHGWHAYADTPWEAEQVVRDNLRSHPTVARDVTLELDLGGPATRIDGGPDFPGELVAGEDHVALYDVAAPSPTVTARWRAGSPVPGEWTRSGEVVGEAPAPFAESAPDLRVGWAVTQLAAHAADGDADWEALHGIVRDAGRSEPVDQELLAMFAMAGRLHRDRRSE